MADTTEKSLVELLKETTFTRVEIPGNLHALIVAELPGGLIVSRSVHESTFTFIPRWAFFGPNPGGAGG